MDWGYQLGIYGGAPETNKYDSYASKIDTWRFSKGSWYHICVVFFTDHEEVYIDGELIWNRFIERKFIITDQATCNYVTIGGGNTGTSGYNWDGSMAEFNYYSNAISPAQVKAEAVRCLAMVTE